MTTYGEGNIGDTAGYVVLVRDRYDPGTWNETPSGVFETIGNAARMVDLYMDQQQHAAHQDTYAIGRVTLVMIVRPGDG